MHDLTVLLVEDNEHNQLLADSYLKKHGVKLDKASNGKIALEKLKTKSYDIILMDLQMPIMDGIEATEHIRNVLKLKTPIIACSAHAMTSERKKCLASGMNDYISKPYAEKTLLQVMAPFLPKSSNGKIKIEPVLASTQPHNGHEQATEPEPVAVQKNEGRRSPEWLAKAVLAKLPEDIRILTEALKLRDWKALEFKAHNLISSLSILHEDLGIELSRQLEKASRECEEKNSMIIGTDLIEFLKTLENAENGS
jgi:CheY-like chemotaxis protein